jgi:fructose-1,6-bisphosphatase/inositol monophosphatase family enzyme
MNPSPKTWADRLCKIGHLVRTKLIESRNAGHDLATAVAKEGGDTIFAVDRHVEPVIDHEIASWKDAPIRLIAEGFGKTGVVDFPGSAPATFGGPQYILIIDPIDGTRNIMYDLRSAWFIAALVPVVPGVAGAPSLANAIVSVAVELPPSKQEWADTYFAIRGLGHSGVSQHLVTGKSRPVTLRPSAAPTIAQGFAMVANFFPGTKVLASELMEHIAVSALGKEAIAGASVFDDQYMTTAGQMLALASGKYRFCADLRPLLYKVIEKQTGKPLLGLECHPYDCAGALIAQAAGVILTDGYGKPLDAPLDVESGVSWIGYANKSIQQKIAPAIQEWFQSKGL